MVASLYREAKVSFLKGIYRTKTKNDRMFNEISFKEEHFMLVFYACEMKTRL